MLYIYAILLQNLLVLQNVGRKVWGRKMRGTNDRNALNEGAKYGAQSVIEAQSAEAYRIGCKV